MSQNKLILKGFLNAFGVFIYVLAVSLFLSNIENIFDSNKPDNFLAPLFMILFFVISASITGFLVLGKPILLYLDNHKKDGFTLLFATLAWLILFAIIVIFVILLK